MALELNWLDQAQANLACGIEFTAMQLKSILFGLKVKTLLAKCPHILDGESSGDTNITVSAFYARVQCGKLLTETEHEYAFAILELKNALCETSLLDNSVTTGEPCKIVSAGLWTMTGGFTYIPVTGILATDSVTVTLTAQDSTETITKAVANPGNNRIDLTFAGTPANTTTKASYSVIRCPLS